MEEVPNLINICTTNPIQVLNLHGLFSKILCVLQMVLLTNLDFDKIDVGTGGTQQRQEVYQE